MSIYLDHAATTPLRREALEQMLPLLTETTATHRRSTGRAGAPEPPSTSHGSVSPLR